MTQKNEKPWLLLLTFLILKSLVESSRERSVWLKEKEGKRGKMIGIPFLVWPVTNSSIRGRLADTYLSYLGWVSSLDFSSISVSISVLFLAVSISLSLILALRLSSFLSNLFGNKIFIFSLKSVPSVCCWAQISLLQNFHFEERKTFERTWARYLNHLLW